MKKKYIIIFIVIFVIGTGAYLMQKKNQKEDLLIHKKRQLKRITEIAKKSNTAGLQPMAKAINQFYKINGRYPKTLLKLYPEFISEKSFILEIKWVYKPEKNDYHLYKNMENHQMVVSIGPDLILTSGQETASSSKKMVASVDNKKVDKTKTKQKHSKKAVAHKNSQAKSNTKSDRKNKQLVKLSPLVLVKTSMDIKTEKNMEQNESKYSNEVVTKKLNRNENFLLSLNNNEIYIWKSKDGYIGFSNVKYPDEKNIAIYKDQSWIKYLD